MLRRAHTQMQTQTCARTQTHPYSGHSHSDPLRLTPIPTHTYLLSHNHTKRTDSHHQTVQTIYSHPYAHSQVHSYSDSTALRLTYAHTHTLDQKERLTHSQTQIQPHSCALKACHSGAPGGRAGGRKAFHLPVSGQIAGSSRAKRFLRHPRRHSLQRPLPIATSQAHDFGTHTGTCQEVRCTRGDIPVDTRLIRVRGPNGLTLSLGAWLVWASATRSLVAVELSFLMKYYC